MENKFKILIVVVIVCSVYPQSAYAYLDPGTGSMIMQVIAASLVGAGCTIGIYKRKIVEFFKNLGNKNDK